MKFTINNNNEMVKGYHEFGELSISTNDQVGFRPYELLISSLVGCSGTLLKNILKKKRFLFESIEIEVSLRRNPNYANRIEQITMIAYIHANQSLSPKQEESIAELVIKNCGMIQSVINAIDITLLVKSAGDSN